VFVIVPSEKFRANWIASDKGPTREETRTLVVGDRRRSDEPREQAIGHTGHRVLFHQHRGYAAQRREQHDRTGAVAADTDDDRRPKPREHTPGVDGARRQKPDAARKRSHGLPLQAGASNRLERKAFARNHA